MSVKELTDEQRASLRRVMTWIENNPLHGVPNEDVSFALETLTCAADYGDGCTVWGYESELDGHHIEVSSAGDISHGCSFGSGGTFGTISPEAARQIAEAFRRAADVGALRVKR